MQSACKPTCKVDEICKSSRPLAKQFAIAIGNVNRDDWHSNNNEAAWKESKIENQNTLADYFDPFEVREWKFVQK